MENGLIKSDKTILQTNYMSIIKPNVSPGSEDMDELQ